MENLEEDLEPLVEKTLLANAVRHGGKAQMSSAVGKILGERPDLRPRAREVKRLAEAMLRSINDLSIEEQSRILASRYPEAVEERPKQAEGPRLPSLPEAEEGKVVTRFPPEPNGYPHIGHAKAAIIDEEYARMYLGRFILRFDDTNPAKERREYYDAIREGLSWLEVRPDLEKNTSDDIELIYGFAERLIQSRNAYVCLCPPEEIRRNRAEMKVCGCRDLDPLASMDRWRRMFDEYEQNRVIVRFRGDMQSLNTVMRDPTLLRIVEAEHPLKGDSYRVWPTYDLAVPIEDSLDGVTHAFRTKEYELRDELYFRLIEILELRRPMLLEFGRLELEGAPVSKRRLRPLIDEGLVSGWDDPRLPTLAGLRRRGFAPKAIREFVLSLGVTKAEAMPSWEILESFNRKILDPMAKRYFFVPNPVKVVVEDAPQYSCRLRLHPEKEMGMRTIQTSGTFHISGDDAAALREGAIFRLIEVYNVEVRSRSEAEIRGVYVGTDLLEGRPKFQWVADDKIDFTVWVAKPPFTEDRFDPESLSEVKGYAEKACSGLKPGEIVQFVRFGFCRMDAPFRAILTHR